MKTGTINYGRALAGYLQSVRGRRLGFVTWAKDEEARALYDRLCAGQKTRRKKAIVAVARKLLVRCWVMLLRNEPWKEETKQVRPVVAIE